MFPGAWMGPVAEQMVPLNCPPGLEYLTLIGKLNVHCTVRDRSIFNEFLTASIGFVWSIKI